MHLLFGFLRVNIIDSISDKIYLGSSDRSSSFVLYCLQDHIEFRVHDQKGSTVHWRTQKEIVHSVK